MTFKVNGMMCMHCVAHVEKALRAVPGVENVVVSLENKSATVTGTATKEAITSAIKDAGYEVTDIN